jgi:hypothetical protein
LSEAVLHTGSIGCKFRNILLYAGHAAAQLVEAVCYKLEFLDASLGTYRYTEGKGQSSWLRQCYKLKVLDASLGT